MRKMKRTKEGFLPALGILGALVLAAGAAGPRTPDPSEERLFAGRIQARAAEFRALEGDTFKVELKIRNLGRSPWESRGEFPCLVSYHLLGAGKEPVQFENPRFPLPRRVLPRETVSLTAGIKAPLEAGTYHLEFDMLREGRAWFKDYGSKTLTVVLKVAKRTWPEDAYVLGLEDGPYTRIESSVPEFNTLMKLIRITLKHTEVSFKGRSGRVDGFSAGAGYPQIWLRDANTIIPASRFFYPASFLSSWLDEHLAFQRPDGSLEDWVDSRGMADKNTVETDQETSAVQAAFQVYNLLGPEWMTKEVKGVANYQRLEDALDYVLKNRFDARHGLITGAHTIDWGDVEMGDAGQNAVYADEKSRWTADIYDQSMFFEAADNLARWYEAAAPRSRAELWRGRARAVRANADKWLWQEDKGFYRLHIHLDSLRHDFDEDDMFGMGGNAQAVLSGLAGQDKARRIFDHAINRQIAFGVSTISGVLLPPYAKGVFRHPAVDEPYEYQNGGQWDWFGGKLILAMFQSGSSRAAKEKLIEIARKNIFNRGFHEWDSREGRGMGSDYFSGSAGSLSRALIEGYFGVHISRFALELTPRLRKDSARIHVHLPAAGRSAAYDYRFDENGPRILFDVNSGAKRSLPDGVEDSSPPCRVRILNPWPPAPGNKPWNAGRDFEVTCDGRRIPCSVPRVGDDEYIGFEVPPGKHAVIVRYLRPTQ